MTLTLEELEANLATLEASLAEAQTLARERATLSYKVQAVTTQFVLGAVPRSQVEDAQSNLDASVEAVIRTSLLEESIKEVKESIKIARGRERGKFCEGIKATFDATYERYKEEGKQVLATFRELQSLDGQYRAMTPRMGGELLAPHERELNLPAVTGSLASRSGFTTGQE